MAKKTKKKEPRKINKQELVSLIAEKTDLYQIAAKSGLIFSVASYDSFPVRPLKKILSKLSAYLVSEWL